MIYDIAGLRISVKNAYEYTDAFCAAYLSDDQTRPADMEVSVSETELEREKSIAIGHSVGYVENICLYREICQRLPHFKRMLLHASIVEYDGACYAFLGRSGTGKSTHTRLWLALVRGAKILNGDKPILAYDQDGFTAYGTPWMGKEGIGYNGVAPLKGLCFLEQAQENVIERLTPTAAAERIFTQIILPNDASSVAKTLELTDKIVSNVPCWLLKCNISETAVKQSFEALTGKPYKRDKE